MDSINKQQAEQNHADLFDKDAAKKIKQLCEKASCFFCTGTSAGTSFKTRPMSVLQVDENN